MSEQTAPAIEIRTYDRLPEEATRIRREVFMEEQGFEAAIADVDGRALHVGAPLDGEAAATCRLFAGEREGELVLGRLAVRGRFRGHHLGARTVAAAEDEARRSGARAIALHAQANKQGFYERCGYAVSGPRDLDEGVPHVWMSKRLGTAGEPR